MTWSQGCCPQQMAFILLDLLEEVYRGCIPPTSMIPRPIPDRLVPLGEHRVPRIVSNGISRHVRPALSRPKKMPEASIDHGAAREQPFVCLFVCSSVSDSAHLSSVPFSRYWVSDLIAIEDAQRMCRWPWQQQQIPIIFPCTAAPDLQKIQGF